jgi:hypothetical protein
MQYFSGVTQPKHTEPNDTDDSQASNTDDTQANNINDTHTNYGTLAHGEQDIKNWNIPLF